VDFLRDRIVPAYKELALFYEDFLTVTGKDGNYIFAPWKEFPRLFESGKSRL
jgi:hypothetical protein